MKINVNNLDQYTNNDDDNQKFREKRAKVRKHTKIKDEFKSKDNKKFNKHKKSNNDDF